MSFYVNCGIRTIHTIIMYVHKCTYGVLMYIVVMLSANEMTVTRADTCVGDSIISGLNCQSSRRRSGNCADLSRVADVAHIRTLFLKYFLC